MTREELEAIYGKVWTTGEVQQEFTIKGFFAPYCAAIRKSDSKRGTLTFQHSPRFYFDFR